MIYRASVVIALFCAACSKTGGGEERASTKVDASLGGRGRLDSPGNDPAVVALARSALACPPAPPAPFNADCAAFRNWNTTGLFVGQPGRDATLVNMLEDSDSRVRFLGARGIARSEGYRVNGPLAARLVTAATNESEAETALMLATAVSHIDVEKAHLTEEVIQFVKSRSVPEVRRAAFTHLLTANPKSRPVFVFALEAMKEPDEKIRFALVDQLVFGASGLDAEVCAAWEGRLEDPSGEVGGRAARNLGASKQCLGNQDKLLEVVERRATTIVPTGYVEGVHRMCDLDKTAAPAKVRGAAFARAVAGNKLNVSIARVAALRAVETCDPAGARVFIAGFKNDGDREVAKAAGKP
ncbi:MAG: hypothetical protein U0174_20665 [Polyangiaceae bacterium]